MRLITSLFLLTTLLVVGFASILHDCLAALLRPEPAVGNVTHES